MAQQAGSGDSFVYQDPTTDHSIFPGWLARPSLGPKDQVRIKKECLGRARSGRISSLRFPSQISPVPLSLVPAYSQSHVASAYPLVLIVASSNPLYPSGKATGDKEPQHIWAGQVPPPLRMMGASSIYV